jgi:hypothetical protein
VTAFYDPYILSKYDDTGSYERHRAGSHHFRPKSNREGNCKFSLPEAVVKKEYDFSNAEQGRFYTRPADAVVPYYLEPDLDDSLRRLAQRHGKKPEELLRVILEKELALLDQIGPAPSAK